MRLQRTLLRLGYDVAFLLLLTLMLPWLLLRLTRRGQWRSQFVQRFGRFDPALSRHLASLQPVWFHAVSVGEANLLVRLVRNFQLQFPDLAVVVSTTTTTGMGELVRQLPKNVPKIYYPLDFRPWVRGSLNSVAPRAVVLVEAEIWPNFLWESANRNLPVLLVNAHVSSRSRDRYRRLSPIFHELFASMDLVACATSGDAQRMAEVGCRPHRIHVVGNLKYDCSADSPAIPQIETLLHQLGLAPGIPVLLGGSTHPGEEALLGRALLQLREGFPQLRLIVFPRHFERAPEAVRDLQALGRKVARRSQAPPSAPSPSTNAPPDALVVDSTGELVAFYKFATIVFIGKSMIAQGGQNPIEPAALAKAIITGPHMQNFAWIMEDLLRHRAVLQVADEAALVAAAARLLADSAGREELGRKAQQVVRASTGGLQRTVSLLGEHLPHPLVSSPVK